jgi:hypothetical protein
MQDSGFFPRAGRVRHLESQNQSPYTRSPKHEHPLLIRTDLIKMPKALRAEINDVVVKYAERKLRNIFRIVPPACLIIFRLIIPPKFVSRAP